MYHHDSGMVRFAEGKLKFAGDRIEFALDRRLVSRVWLGDGPRHWTPRKVLYVECRPTEKSASMVFSLQSLEACIWPFTTRAARDLYRQVEAWRSCPAGDVQPVAGAGLTPVEGEPDSSIPLRVALKSGIIYATIGFTVYVFMGVRTMTEMQSSFGAFVLFLWLAVFALLPRLKWLPGKTPLVRK